MTNSIVLMGVSGSGKTSIGLALSIELGWSFYDGDDYHSSDSVQKMAQGLPLSDEDRKGWLVTLSNLIMEKRQVGENIILACSALKKSYRKQLRNGNQNLIFVFLDDHFDLIWNRMQTREKHFMKPEMLKSQFVTLEPPRNALTINIDRPVSEIVQEIIEFVI